MPRKLLRTSDLARAVGVHPNTVRLYADWGLIPPVERTPSGYRVFTQHHLDCLQLARTIYAAQYPGRGFRARGTAIIHGAVAGDWAGVLEKAEELSQAVSAELGQAQRAAELLEHWAKNMDEQPESEAEPVAIGDASKQLGVSLDIIRNWERAGLLRVPRNSRNNYRLFGKKEIERMQIIRMLSLAGYSHMAMLRMFLELDKGNRRDLTKALDTPRPDEDIFTAADHWLTTLQKQEQLAQNVIQFIKEKMTSK